MSKGKKSSKIKQISKEISTADLHSILLQNVM